MKLKQLIKDDDAVSPVIGVILMVAITVILAAVIASFVLGLGSTDDPAPNPTIEWSDDGEVVTLDFTGGDSFDPSDMEVDGDNLNVSDGTAITSLDEDNASINDDDNPADHDGDIGGGDTLEIHYGEDGSDDWEVELYWNPADSDRELVTSESS